MSALTITPAPADAPAEAGPAAGVAAGVPSDAPVARRRLDFDPSAAWALSPQVALRPERFGALAYHFGTRRLSFLKSPRLLAVVEALADHESATAACAAVGITGSEVAAMETALATLARTDMIVLRTAT